jgi:hypothetical protein
MTTASVLWASLRDLVIAVGRRLIGKLLRRVALRWAHRRIAVLRDQLLHLRKNAPAWRVRWIKARLSVWERVAHWAEYNELNVSRERLCACRDIAKKEGIPMDSPDDVEPKRAPRRAA